MVASGCSSYHLSATVSISGNKRTNRKTEAEIWNEERLQISGESGKRTQKKEQITTERKAIETYKKLPA